MAMEGAWTTTNASNNNNKTSLNGWGTDGDYWDNAVTLVDGFSLQGCESSIATTRLLAESENDFGHFRLETCVPFLTSPAPEAPRSRLPVRAPAPPHVRPPVPPKPAAPSTFISSKQTIPLKPSIPAKPTIAPKPSHLAGKLKTVGGGFSTTIKVEGEKSVVVPPRSNDTSVSKPHFQTSADSRTSALIDNSPCESGTKKGDNATGFCESEVVTANHCIGRAGESESSGAFKPAGEGGKVANDKSGGTFGEAGGCDAANGDSLKADTGRSNSAVGDRDMNCRALIEKFNTINQGTKGIGSTTSEKGASDESADELKSKSKDSRCNGSETSSVSGVWRVVSSTHQPRQPPKPQTPNDETEMSIKNKKKKGCLGIMDSDDGTFDLLTSTTSSSLMQPEVVESEWRHISSLATQYEFGEESLTSLSSSSSSRIPVRTRKESVFDKAESRRRESEVWRKDSGISLTSSGCSSPARRLSYPDRSVTPSGSRSYLERTSTPVGSRSSTPSLLAMRSSTPSLATMRSSTPCLLPRPITPSCGRSSTPSLPPCRSTTPSLPSLLPRPTTPLVGGRPTTPSLGSLLPRPTTPSRSLSARRGSLSLPLRSSEARSSRLSLPSFSPISLRSSRPPPSLTLSSSTMGVVGEPSLARRWDSTPSLEVSSSHPFHPRFPLPCSGRAGEPMNPEFCPDFLLWNRPGCQLDNFSCFLPEQSSLVQRVSLLS